MAVALERARVTARDARERRRHTVLIPCMLAVLVLSVTVYCLAISDFSDVRIYRLGGHAWLHDVPLYSDAFRDLLPSVDLPFLYPTFSAILFSPLTWLPLPLAVVALTLLSGLALLGTALVTAGREYGRTTTALAVGFGVAGLGMAFEPVRQTMSLGQINLILMGLVVADCLLPRVRWPRGMLVGLAAAIKLTPAIFVLFFLVRRQYRAAVVAVGSFAAFGVAGFVLAPRDSIAYWFDFVFRTDKAIGATYATNQSLQGALSRFMADGAGRTALWLALVLLALGLALLAARRARAACDDVTAMLAVALFGLLASPISWSHHWVWIVPAAVALLHRGALGGRPMRAVAVLTAAMFTYGAHTAMPTGGDEELSWAWWQHLLGSSYTLFAIGTLVVLAARRPAPRREEFLPGPASPVLTAPRPG